MNRLKAIALVATVALLSPLPAWAQRPLVSPHETVSGVIDGNRVTIVYGRPYSKDPAAARYARFGERWFPMAKPGGWVPMKPRFLLTRRTSEFGDTTSVPPGAYTLYMVPEENGGKLAISKSLGGLGDSG